MKFRRKIHANDDLIFIPVSGSLCSLDKSVLKKHDLFVTMHFGQCERFHDVMPNRAKHLLLMSVVILAVLDTTLSCANVATCRCYKDESDVTVYFQKRPVPVPGAFCERANLTEVYHAFAPATKTLHLPFNRITNLSKVLFDYPRLEFLNLSFNSIRELGTNDFDGTKQLRVLDLTKNHLMRLDAEILRELRDLSYLYLSGNVLHGLEENVFAEASGLVYLDLSNNALYDVRFLVQRTSGSLETVLLAGNKALQSKAFAFPSPNDNNTDLAAGISTLDVSRTSVANLTILLSRFPQLLSLRVEQCGVEELWLNNLGNLSYLGLADNRIGQLRFGMDVEEFLPVNLTVDLSANRLKCDCSLLLLSKLLLGDRFRHTIQGIGCVDNGALRSSSLAEQCRPASSTVGFVGIVIIGLLIAGLLVITALLILYCHRRLVKKFAAHSETTSVSFFNDSAHPLIGRSLPSMTNCTIITQAPGSSEHPYLIDDGYVNQEEYKHGAPFYTGEEIPEMEPIYASIGDEYVNQVHIDEAQRVDRPHHPDLLTHL